MSQEVAHRSLKEKQRFERELLILQKGDEVLLEKGYRDTSMDEIASRVGVAKGTVYLHFPSKDTLVVAILERDMQRVLQHVEEICNSTETVYRKLEKIFYTMYTDFFGKRIQLFSVLRENPDLQRSLSEKKGCMLDLWQQFSGNMQALLEEGKSRGELDTTIPTPVMLRALLSLITAKGYDQLILGDQESMEEVVKHLTKIYFRGIASV